MIVHEFARVHHCPAQILQAAPQGTAALGVGGGGLGYNGITNSVAVKFDYWPHLTQTGVYAYGEAASHLERCLAVQEVLDPDDKAKRCDLLLALGEALISRVGHYVEHDPFDEPNLCFRGVTPLGTPVWVDRWVAEADFVAARPGIEDFPIILRGSKGEIRERDPAALMALACREGWSDTCF